MKAKRKVCTKCGVEKGFRAYHRHAGGRFGRRSWCKACASKRRRVEFDRRKLPRTEEQKARLSAALKGHAVSPETRAKISAALKGNLNSMGRKLSPETRRRIGNAHRGASHSKGIKRPAAWCAKLSARMKGNTFKLGHKDGPATIARKRGAMLARHGRRVLPSPAPGVMGFAPDYRAERVVFFRP